MACVANSTAVPFRWLALQELAESQGDTRQAIAERDEAKAEARLTMEQKKEVEKELDFMTAKVVAAGTYRGRQP